MCDGVGSRLWKSEMMALPAVSGLDDEPGGALSSQEGSFPICQQSHGTWSY